MSSALLSTVGTATRSTPTSLSTNRLTGSVSYDSAGNMTSWNGAVYSFDVLDRLWQMTNGSQDWRHMYTADGERLFSFRANGGPSRWILRDLDGKILREYENDAGTWTVYKDYVYRGNHAAAIYTGFNAPQDRVHFHTDHLGSVRALTDSNGNRFSYHLFYPFGEEATSITQDAGRLKFTGHERDLGDFYSAADDLDYMHARYYNPQLGRFLGVDPKGRYDVSAQRRDPNRYAYARNNPLRFLDPDGNESAQFTLDLAVEEYRTQGHAPAWHDDRLVAGASFVTALLSPVDEFVALGRIASAGGRALARLFRATDTAKDAARPGRTVSRYEDITQGSSVANRRVDMNLEDFGKNLENQGFTRTQSKDGKVTIFTKGDTRYTVRSTSNSGSPTAELIENGERKLKIRLAE